MIDRNVAKNNKVLFVDLDGTLIATDMAWECLLHHLKHNPLAPFLWFFWLLRGPFFLKTKLSRFLKAEYTRLPYRQNVIQVIESFKKNNYEIVLATASMKEIALKVSSALGIFDHVIASTEHLNVKGIRKLEKIKEYAGNRDWLYIGDSSADIVIWKSSGKGIGVNLSRMTRSALESIQSDSGTNTKADNQSHVHSSNKVDGQSQFHSNIQMTYLDDKKEFIFKKIFKAIRIHQSVKNLLIFVPLIAAHKWHDANAVFHTFMAFVSFSFAAFSVYVLNDLLDLDSDRGHWSKKNRLFASGKLSIAFGFFLSPMLLLISATIAFFTLPQEFHFALLLYICLTLLYSLRLKRIILLDIFCLSLLYTIRIFSGSGATGIEVSNWLLAFAVFSFSGLATLKRYIEIVAAEKNHVETLTGRGYIIKDKQVLLVSGISSSFLSLVIMALYFSSPEIHALYQHSDRLWFLIPICLYWFSRIWIIANRGEADDDPVVLVLKDRTSIVFVALFMVVLWSAI